MLSRKTFVDDADDWQAKFSSRLTAYQQLVDEQRKREAQFEAERQAALDELKRLFLQERRAPEEQLFEVAPISVGDVDAIPTKRAAYSDRTAAMMAKIASLTYVSFEDEVKRKALDGLLTHGHVRLLETLSVDETEALVAETEKFVVVAFRGTTSRRDLRTDLQTRFNVSTADVAGRSTSVAVHSGFYHAYSKLASQLEKRLAEIPNKPIYLTGHSLGGALALVASAALAGRPEFGDRIAAVYTFGAPRVGKRTFSEIVKAPHYRVVNKGDIVPLVPPTWLRGYVHTGTPILLKPGANKPSFKRPWGTATMYAALSLILWPLTRQLLFLRRHDSMLYVTRLERIARHRGKWT
jgi:hypothetical protein